MRTGPATVEGDNARATRALDHGGILPRVGTRTAGPAPRLSESHAIGLLQSAAGNKAVTDLLSGLARPTRPVPLQRQQAPSAAVPASDRPQTASNDVEALLRLIAPAVARLRAVPDTEVITSTSAGELSRRELADEIARLWRRRRMTFTAAARRAAATDASGPRRMQTGATAADEQFGQRWALTLLAWDYRRWADMPDIAELMRRGAPFGAALRAEYGRVVPVNNPTGAQMRDRIVATVVDLAFSLQPGEIGQLMIAFSGHGRNGAIYGVDGEAIEPDWLLERARFAANLGVQLVYVLDTCRAGLLVQLAQRRAATGLEEAAAVLPSGRRSAVEPLLAYRRAVADPAERIGVLTVDLGGLARQLERRRPSSAAHGGGGVDTLSAQDALWLSVVESLTAIGSTNDELYDALRNPPGGAPPADQLRTAVANLSVTVLGATAATPGALARSMRQIAVVLDLASDYQNAVVAVIRGQMGGGPDATSPPPRPG